MINANANAADIFNRTVGVLAPETVDAVCEYLMMEGNDEPSPAEILACWAYFATRQA